MSEQKFEVGTVVTLKSEPGIKMTITVYNSGKAHCVWFQPNTYEFKEALIYPSALVEVKPKA